jgi:hypothetical protein
MSSLREGVYFNIKKHLIYCRLCALAKEIWRHLFAFILWLMPGCHDLRSGDMALVSSAHNKRSYEFAFSLYE